MGPSLFEGCLRPRGRAPLPRPAGTGRGQRRSSPGTRQARLASNAVEVGRMARRRWIPWIAVVVVLGACGPGGAGPDAPGPGGDDLHNLREQARDDLARYEQAVVDAGGSPFFVPVGELTGQVGDWEPQNEDSTEAWLSGRFVAATGLPAAPQRTGKVIWDNGPT